MAKLLREFTDFSNLQILTEGSGPGKEMRIKGPFLQAEVKNNNNREYSKDICEREVIKLNEEKISKGRALGELDHPPSPVVNLERVSHMIESLKMDGNTGMGVARILDTTMGKTAKILINSGASLGVSTRGVGTLKGSKVADDYKLITIDIVADPSAPGAFVEGIMESKDYLIDGDTIVEVAINRLQNTLSKGKKKEQSKHILESLNVFLKEIRNA